MLLRLEAGEDVAEGGSSAAAAAPALGVVPGGISFLKAVGYVKDGAENALILGKKTYHSFI